MCLLLLHSAFRGTWQWPKSAVANCQYSVHTDIYPRHFAEMCNRIQSFVSFHSQLQLKSAQVWFSATFGRWPRADNKQPLATDLHSGQRSCRESRGKRKRSKSSSSSSAHRMDSCNWMECTDKSSVASFVVHQKVILNCEEDGSNSERSEWSKTMSI